MSAVANLGALIASYGAPIKVNSMKVATLATLLVLAAPSDLGADGKKRLKLVTKAAKGVSSVQTARERGSAARLQGPRNKLAISFSALYEILGGLARIPAEVDDVGRRAGAIQSSLFPDALTFTRLEAAATWAHATRLLDRIEEEGLEPQIEAMAGPAVLAWIRIALKELGMAIGIGSEPVASTGSSDLMRAVTAFQNAVASYVRVLAAAVDEDDAKSVERFFKAVAPIDQLRSRANGSSEPDEEEETDVVPVEPTPVVTPVAPTDAPVADN
jgi:hypothetical protein